MSRKHFTNEQIPFALRQAENGATVDEVCRKMGVSDRHEQRPRQPCAALTAQYHVDIDLRLRQPVAAARLARAQPRHGLGEDPPRAIAAPEAAYPHPPRHRPILLGQVHERPLIPAVHPRRCTLTDPTGGVGLRGPGGDQQPRSSQRQVIDIQAARERRHRRVRDQHRAALGLPRGPTPGSPRSTESADGPCFDGDLHAGPTRTTIQSSPAPADIRVRPYCITPGLIQAAVLASPAEARRPRPGGSRGRLARPEGCRGGQGRRSRPPVLPDRSVPLWSTAVGKNQMPQRSMNGWAKRKPAVSASWRALLPASGRTKTPLGLR